MAFSPPEAITGTAPHQRQRAPDQHCRRRQLGPASRTTRCSRWSQRTSEQPRLDGSGPAQKALPAGAAAHSHPATVLRHAAHAGPGSRRRHRRRQIGASWLLPTASAAYALASQPQTQDGPRPARHTRQRRHASSAPACPRSRPKRPRRASTGTSPAIAPAPSRASSSGCPSCPTASSSGSRATWWPAGRRTATRTT